GPPGTGPGLGQRVSGPQDTGQMACRSSAAAAGRPCGARALAASVVCRTPTGIPGLAGRVLHRPDRHGTVLSGRGSWHADQAARCRGAVMTLLRDLIDIPTSVGDADF